MNTENQENIKKEQTATATRKESKQNMQKNWLTKIWFFITQMIAIFFIIHGLISWLNQNQTQNQNTENQKNTNNTSSQISNLAAPLLNPLLTFFQLPPLHDVNSAQNSSNLNNSNNPNNINNLNNQAKTFLADAGPQYNYRETAKKAMSSVVSINTTRNRETRAISPLFEYFFGAAPDGQEAGKSKSPQNVPLGLGSGVIMRSDGYIMTNQHVIEDADEITVTLNTGEKFKADLIGADKETDLALLKVARGDLLSAQINQDLQVGDVVLAIGNPFGVGQTVTSGIVSAMGRKELGINTFENFIQTDAAINPGNSGGALVDTAGNLVGINTAIFSKSGGWQGIGFAIPASLVVDIMEQILKQGKVLRGYMGISPQDLTASMRDLLGKNIEGALVAGLVENGPAEQAGLERGDVILAINSKSIQNSQQLLYMVAQYKPQEEINCTILRQQKTLNIKVRLGTRPTPAQLQDDSALE